MWARPHPKDATASDHVPRPNNWQLVGAFFFRLLLWTLTSLAFTDRRYRLGDCLCHQARDHRYIHQPGCATDIPSQSWSQQAVFPSQS